MSDSLALVDLYDSTGEESWANIETTYWNGTSNTAIPNTGTTLNFNQPIDTWHGALLNSSDCVEILALNSNNLLGNLIDMNLSNLTNLALSNNQFSGNITGFTNLPWLNFRYNQFTFEDITTNHNINSSNIST
jgi:hypothetical protein